MNKRKVIIDTDPGIDDLLALSVALASENLDILAISTVFGNVSLEHTTKNAKLICDMFDREMQIIKGSSKPLFYERKGNATVHGADGLGGLFEKYRDKANVLNKEDVGIVHLYNLIKNSEEKVTIIALGPLTNIAKLLLIDESIKDNIEEIHIMGGGLGRGNVSELVEFNFYSDGYAAKAVLTSDIPIILSPLNVTTKVYFTDKEFEDFGNDSLRQKFIKDSVEYYVGLDPYLHDIVSILSLTNPEFFNFKEVAINVVADSSIADGMSYVLRDQNINKNVRLVDTDQRENIIKHISKIVEQV